MDVQFLKKLGVQFYRFSISWPRVLPTGLVSQVNYKGLKYYEDLVHELVRNGIAPVITLYHWDLPQALQNIGGWVNPAMSDIFADYAKFMFVALGAKVKTWITINEPRQVCKFGYGDGRLAPGLTFGGTKDYDCVKTILLAHAKAYHIYKSLKLLHPGMCCNTCVSYVNPINHKIHTRDRKSVV